MRGLRVARVVIRLLQQAHQPWCSRSKRPLTLGGARVRRRFRPPVTCNAGAPGVPRRKALDESITRYEDSGAEHGTSLRRAPTSHGFAIVPVADVVPFLGLCAPPPAWHRRKMAGFDRALRRTDR